MFTNEEAGYLLGLEKVFERNLKDFDLNKYPKYTIDLISPKDVNYKFRLDIKSNHKITLKVSLHHMESNSFIGLSRIDFKGRHTNPKELTDDVPEYLKTYVGKSFKIDEPHIHIYVQGYKPLAWAMPLADSDFPIKRITDLTNIYELIIKFAQRINVTSEFTIQNKLL